MGLKETEFMSRARSVNQTNEIQNAMQLFGMISESAIAEQISRYLEPYLAPLAPLLEALGGTQRETKTVIEKKDERARAAQ